MTVTNILVFLILFIAYAASSSNEETVALSDRLDNYEQNMAAMAEKLDQYQQRVIALEEQLGQEVTARQETRQELSKVRERLEEENGKRNAMQNPVAFAVALNSEDFGPVEEDTIVPYDYIFLNYGDGFNTSSHKFVAPVAGLYSFTMHGFARSPDKDIWISLIHDGSMICRAADDDRDNGGGTGNTVILAIEKGEEVWVELLADPYNILYGHITRYNTFSGFLYMEY